MQLSIFSSHEYNALKGLLNICNHKIGIVLCDSFFLRDLLLRCLEQLTNLRQTLEDKLFI